MKIAPPAGDTRRGMARHARMPVQRPRAQTVQVGGSGAAPRANTSRIRVDSVRSMEYRTLGRSGLRISVLTMGTMTFGGSGPFKNVGSTGAAEAERQVDMCLDAGVNLIDTADVYSGGQAEEILGQVLHGRGRRDRVLVATKVRMPMGRDPNDAGLSRHHIISGCEASLRRLGTDHIDLYQVHEWDGQTPLEETLEALSHLVNAGKVRYVGASNYTAWQLMKALGTADRWACRSSSASRSTTRSRPARRSTS
jgi:aryl-alcohol dehydrogenase-like predicted oxidoreductase